MKRIVLTIAVFGIALFVKAQNETVNGNLTVTGATNSKSRIEIKADNGVGHVASRLYLESHNNSRGAGVFSLGQTNKWFMGNPYTDHANAFMIGVAPNTISTDATAQKQYAKFYVNSNGNVGIGTTNPSAKLHVNGNIGIGLMSGTFSSGLNIEYIDGGAGTTTFKSNRWGGNIYFKRSSSSGERNQVSFGGSGHHYMNIYNTNNEVRVRFSSGGNSYLNGGNLGIGTTNPTAKLESITPNGNSKSLRLGRVDNSNYWDVNHAGNDFRLYNVANSGSDILFGVDPGGNIKNNNVGIGTANPNGWKLAVNGNIRAKEIKVETGWSDFVFYDDYNLPTLAEVEKHIKEKGHLKDIPSAVAVAKNGIFLGEMDAKLLQKIEELTLYTIEQQKEIKQLKEQVTEIAELKLLVQKLLESKN